MIYNPDLINSKFMRFLDKDIETYFDDGSLKELYILDKENLYKYKKFNDGRNRLKIDIIENYVLYLFCKKDKSLDEERILLKAKSFYSMLASKQKIFYLNNAIFKNSNILGDKFFLDYNTVKKTKESILDELRYYYIDYMTEKNMSDEKIIRLMEFLIGNIDNKSFNNVLENVFNKVINFKRDLLMSEKNFLIQYISYKKCKSYNMPMAKVYITNTDLIHGKKLTNNDCLGSFHSDFNCLISLNECFYSKKSNTLMSLYNVSHFTKQIHTLCHELEHYKQMNLLNNGTLNASSFAMIKTIIFKKYLSDNDFREYEENYEYKEIEREANINGWKNVINLFQKYNVNHRTNEIEQCANIYKRTAMEKANAWQKIRRGKIEKKILLEQYNIIELIEIVRDHSELLNEYTQLKHFFYDNGKIHSPFNFFEQYNKLDLEKEKTHDSNNVKRIEETQECYYEFINYIFIYNDLNSINFSGHSEELLITFFSLLEKSLCLELEKIDHMCETFKKTNIDDFEIIINKRVDRVNKYYNFILNNKSLLKTLDMYDKNNVDRKRRFTLYDKFDDIDLKKSNVAFKVIELVENNPILKESERRYG